MEGQLFSLFSSFVYGLQEAINQSAEVCNEFLRIWTKAHSSEQDCCEWVEKVSECFDSNILFVIDFRSSIDLLWYTLIWMSV